MLSDKLSKTEKAEKYARDLRQDQTPGEKVFWKMIRNRRFYGYKFRRQVPIGPYIVDFLCVEQNLIIEIDGDSHYEPGATEYDKKRDEYLRLKGFTVLRFGNRQTIESVNEVLRSIARYLGEEIE